MRVVQAQHSYETHTLGRLSLQEGDVVWVLQEHESGWYDGVLKGNRGWFPSNFCTQPIDSSLDFSNAQQMNDYGWVKQPDGVWSNSLTGEMMQEPLKINVDILRRGSEASSNTSVKTNLSLSASWKDVRKLVSQQIIQLKDAQPDQQIEFVDMVLGTVHNMLVASNTFSKQSPILLSSKVLKTHHKHVVKSLAQLSKQGVSTEITAASHHSFNELWLAVRNFTELAEQMNIPLQLEQTVTQVKQLDRMSPYPSSAVSETPSLSVQQELSIHLQPATQDVIEILNQIKDSVKSKQCKPLDIIDLTRSIVTKIGQLLSLLDELDASAFDNQPQLELKVSAELNSETMKAYNVFSERKEQLYQNIFDLVNTTTQNGESFAQSDSAPSDSARRLLKAINTVHQALLRLVDTVKPRIAVWQYQDVEGARLRRVLSDTIEAVDFEQPSQRRSQSMNFKVSKQPSLLISTIPQGVACQTESSPNKLTSMFNRISLSSPLSVSMPAMAFSDKRKSQSPISRRVTIIGAEENKASKVLGESVSLQGQRYSTQLLNGHLFLGPDVTDKEVQYSKSGDIKGATLPALVKILTDHRSVDVQLMQYFLLTYRTFAQSTEVLKLLFERFNMPCPPELNEEDATIWRTQKQKPVRLRVYNIIKTWLESYFYTDQDLEALPMLETFCSNTLQHILPSATEKMVKLIERLRHKQLDDKKLRRKTFMNPLAQAVSLTAPQPSLPRRWSNSMSILDFDSLEIARQLTLHDFQLYFNIQPIEFLQKAWSDKQNDYAPNIKKLIQVSNKVTAWVADTILSQEDVKQRAAVIKQFVQVADKCRSLNNFNTLMSILAALASSPVYRLKRSFDLLSNKSQVLLTELKEQMSPASNFANYRQVLKQIQPPCFPFLGRYLTDLTFIEDGNPDYLKSHPNMINMDKRLKAAQKVLEIQQYQQSQYNLQFVPEIQNWLEHNLEHSETDNDKLYDLSMVLEPRERDDETMARMLSETGLI